MRGYLLDTNIALLALAAPERIAPGILKQVETGPVYLSVVSFWEVVLKCMKGKLALGDPRAWWPDALDNLSATALPLRPDHIAEVCQLPPIHQDPFDRVLIAQASVEDLMLVTSDGAVPKYASARFHCLY